MTKIKAVLSFFLTVMFLLVTPGQAEETKKPQQKADFLKTVDKNADGKASKAEFMSAMEKKFHSLDVDKSEVISLQELKIYGEKDPEAIKKAQQATQAQITPLDEKIALETAYGRELIYAEWETPQIATEAKPMPTMQTSVAAQAESYDKVNPKQKLINAFFVGIDANHDGQISHKEKTVAFESLFNHLDSNHDQLITQDEIIAGRHSSTTDNP